MRCNKEGFGALGFGWSLVGLLLFCYSCSEKCDEDGCGQTAAAGSTSFSFLILPLLSSFRLSSTVLSGAEARESHHFGCIAVVVLTWTSSSN